MDNRFNDVTLQNIVGTPHEVLKDKLAVSDNIDKRDYPAFSQIKDKVITKNMQYSPAVLAFVCVGGNAEIEIDFKRHCLSAGDALVITHKQVGEVINMTDDIRYFLIAINDSFYDPNINNSDPNRNRNLIEKMPFVHLTETAISDSMALYRLIKKKLCEKPHLYQIETIKGMIHAFFFNIFSELAKKENPLPAIEASPADSRQKEVYTAFLKAVGEHYTIERNIKYYADILCITPKYLSQIIYQVSGRFAGDYIRDYVVREAKALIRSKRYSMLDISVMLNFSTQSSFTRFFKNATNMSPLEYQNKA